VVDARKVRFKGDWQSKVDAEQRVSMETGKMKRLMFDVTEAGPGINLLYLMSYFQIKTFGKLFVFI